MTGTTRKYCLLSSLTFPEKCPWKSFCGLVQCDLNEPEVVIFDKWCFVKAESSLPRSRFLDVTQRLGSVAWHPKTVARETRQSPAFKKFHFRPLLRCAICLQILWAGSCSNSISLTPPPLPPFPSALRSEYLTTSPKCGIKLNCQAKTSCLESITVLSVILE